MSSLDGMAAVPDTQIQLLCSVLHATLTGRQRCWVQAATHSAQSTWKPGLVSTMGTSGPEASVVMKAFSSSPSTSSLWVTHPSDSPVPWPRSGPLSSLSSRMCFRTLPMRSSTGIPLMMLRALCHHQTALSYKTTRSVRHSRIKLPVMVMCMARSCFDKMHMCTMTASTQQYIGSSTCLWESSRSS